RNRGSYSYPSCIGGCCAPMLRQTVPQCPQNSARVRCWAEFELRKSARFSHRLSIRSSWFKSLREDGQRLSTLVRHLYALLEYGIRKTCCRAHQPRPSRRGPLPMEVSLALTT